MSNADLFDLELNDPSNDTLQSEDKSDDDHIEIDEDRVQVLINTKHNIAHLLIAGNGKCRN